VPGGGPVLVCFHHAGGAASAYRGWAEPLSHHGIEVWPVQLPGRETRYSEPLTTDLQAVVTALSDLVHEQLAGRPYALYGHSAGAMLAYGFALAAGGGGRPAPRHLFVGACRPPGRPDPDFPLHRLAPDRFRDRLLGYGRIPAEILRYPEMMEMMTATARADLELVESHPWSPDDRVNCPVTALGGVGDAAVPTDTLPAWREVTTGPFEQVLLPGGHFPAAAGEELVREVVRRGLR
jgi:medium-chain acyl-[acyl-carrier-protein] hydrolase